MTSLILRARVHPDVPAARGCLSYWMYSCRNPSHVMSASTLTLRSGNCRNASMTARSIRKKSAPVAGMSFMPTTVRMTQ